ncbi:MAG TPA: hypothetical protein PLE33_05795 [Candidatus Cloacimonas sp.]|nr:hypothetical protein [Candidatus Cloacimonas sp.]HPS60757.1 hypothetical protein [Candidatus Cloacimonas sp.]
MEKEAKFLTKPVNYIIGEINYEQSPLGLGKTGELLSLIAESINKLDLDKENVDLKKVDTEKSEDMLKMLSTLLKKAPEIVTQMVCILLGAETEEDKKNIDKNCSLKTLLSIAKTFISQNDIMGVKNDFLELISMVKASK